MVSGRVPWVEKQEYQCEECEKAIIDYASNRTGGHVFCSSKCAAIFRNKKPKSTCVICGKEVKTSRNLFCSRNCRGKSQRSGKLIKCKICKKECYRPLNRIKRTQWFYCSQECKNKDPELIEHIQNALKIKRLEHGETLPEKIVRQILLALDLTFEQEKRIGKYFIDFFLPDYNLCIEADGDYWHGNKQTDKFINSLSQQHAIKRDLEKNRFLEREGYRVIRFWENDIKTKRGKVFANIKEAIR